MRHKKRASEEAKVREAIAIWRKKNPEPDNHAKLVLTRLEKDSRAAEAFSILNLPPDLAAIVVGDCVIMDLNARTFAIRLAKEEAIQKSLQVAKDGLKACAELLGNATRPKDALEAFVPLDPKQIDRLMQGLNDWEALISLRERIAHETPRRVGATYKRTGKKLRPAHRAAISWLADGVRRLTNKPHYEAVGKLAEVVLRPPQAIDVSQVRSVWRGRKEWRIKSAKID